MMVRSFVVLSLVFCSGAVTVGAEYLNGIEWKMPPIVKPGNSDSDAPADAIVLFDGKDLSHWQNADRVARYLDAHDQVESVRYAGLESSPWHERAKRYGGGKGYGSVLAFEIRGGQEAGKKFVEGLTLHSHVANIGDARSLVIQPASTTHSQLTPEEQAASDVTPGLIRLSVGLESIDDILADLDQGFAAAAG